MMHRAIHGVKGDGAAGDFVGTGLAEFANDDSALPIDEAQTIPKPYIIALTTEVLDPEPEDRVRRSGTRRYNSQL